MIKEVNSQNFQEEVIGCSDPVLVDFYAKWCGPCKQMSPVISKLAKEYKGNMNAMEAAVRHFISFSGLEIPCKINSWHEFDAILAYWGGMRIIAGEAETYGEAEEGIIYA